MFFKVWFKLLSILDLATTKYQAKLKEGIYTPKKPNLNKQKKPPVYYFINLINFYGSFFLSFNIWFYNSHFNRFNNSLFRITT